MASDADRLRAERLYVEGGKSIAVIASDIGVHRSTVYEWRNEGDWDSKRRQLADKIQRAQAEATDSVVAAVATTHRLLSRFEGLGILADLARSSDVFPKDRIAAIKLASDLEKWAGTPDEGDGPPKRLVLEDPGNG